MVVARFAHQLPSEVHHGLDVLVAHLGGPIEPPLERLVVMARRFQIHANMYLTHGNLLSCNVADVACNSPFDIRSSTRLSINHREFRRDADLTTAAAARDDRPNQVPAVAGVRLRSRRPGHHGSQEVPSMTVHRETLTPRERMLTALEHRQPDRVPIDLGGNQTGIHRLAYESLLQRLGWEEEIEIMDAVQQLAQPSEAVLERLKVDTRYIHAGSRRRLLRRHRHGPARRSHLARSDR